MGEQRHALGRVGVRLADGWRARVDPGWLAGWEPRPFDLGDGATEVVVMGEGPPLLLVPPLPGFKEAFLGVARRLSRSFQVVTFDLRARFAGPPSWQALLADLERVADAFAPGPAVVVGHSLGGALAQRWALERPHRVAALVLSSSFASVTSPRGHAFKRYLEQPLVLASQRWLPERWARPLARRFAEGGAWVFDPRCDARIQDFVRFAIRRLPIGVAAQCVRLAFAHDLRGALPALRAPTLLLVGERETAFARTATAELARLLPHAETKVSPGVSHLHPLSAPGWFADTVERWVGERAAVAGG